MTTRRHSSRRGGPTASASPRIRAWRQVHANQDPDLDDTDDQDDDQDDEEQD